MSKQVLGKGLSALIPSGSEQESGSEPSGFQMVRVDMIAPNPMQPRKQFRDERLAELTESIRENGVLQPLLLKKVGEKFAIVAGERRFRAARLAGLTDVPAVVRTDIDDVRALELALVENVQREDLNPVELAAGYRRLIDECGLTQNDLSRRVGKSRAVIANHMRLLSLPEAIKKWLMEGKLTEGHGRALLALDNEVQMLSTARNIVENTLSVREVEKKTRKRGRSLPKSRTPAVLEMENHLKSLLGTSVKISSGLKRGRIEIEYYGDEDLDRLWQLFRRIDS